MHSALQVLLILSENAVILRIHWLGLTVKTSQENVPSESSSTVLNEQNMAAAPFSLFIVICLLSPPSRSLSLLILKVVTSTLSYF